MIDSNYNFNLPGTSGEIGPKNCLTWEEDNKSLLVKSGFEPTTFELMLPPMLRFFTTPFCWENIYFLIKFLTIFQTVLMI